MLEMRNPSDLPANYRTDTQAAITATTERGRRSAAHSRRTIDSTSAKPNTANMRQSSRTEQPALICPRRPLNKHTTSQREESSKYICTCRTSTNKIPLQRHTSSYFWLIALMSILVTIVHCEDVMFWARPAPVGASPTPGPEENFREQPANTSVVVGDIAIMKCKANRPVHHCRWYYMETNGSFYAAGAQPTLVKQFDPSTDNDCSIRFTKVRKVQEGQWLCQARKYMGTTHYNTRPAFLQVITASDEQEYGERSPEVPTSPGDEASTTRDPTAPTAIPALGPPPSSGPLPFPARGPLTPHPGDAGPDTAATPQGAPPSPAEVSQETPHFNYSSDDHIQNTETGATTTLPCHVGTSVTSCAWVMPNNALFVWNEADSSVGRSLSINTPRGPPGPQDYEFVGDRDAGDCSLRVYSVQHHDEGNWRCVVSTKAQRQSPAVHRAFAAGEPAPEVDFQGPLIHLHILDFHHGAPLDDNPKSKPGANTTLIVLFMVGLLLFAVGAIVIYCCYKKVWSKPEENSKILQVSPQNSDSEYSQQWFRGRNLKITDPNYTDDFKLRNAAAPAPGDYQVKNVDAMNLKNAAVKYTDIDHYNQYLSMKQPGLASARSSASSNTTLSTMAPDPYAHDRSMGFTTSPSMSPASNMSGVMIQRPGFGVMNPGGIPTGPPHEDTIPFYELHRQLQRPVSLYSTSHVYEEIEDKIPHQKGMPQIIGHDGKGIIFQAQPLPNGQIATTPVYTNVVEDHDGYLIPSKSAKIINTPTGEEPTQYLPMKGDGSVDNGSETMGRPVHPQHNAFIPNLNNLSFNQRPTVHKQILDDQENAPSVMQQRRKSNESTLSDENNYSPEEKRGRTENPNLQESTPVKRSPHKSASTTPTSKRQRMPLPAAPTETSTTSGQTGQQQTKGHEEPMGLKRMSQDMDSTGKAQASLPASLHQRTTSLPDTSSQGGGTAHHSKSPSLIPTPENYDVPRSLDAVPRSVNGSEISLDDIDGTIV